MAEKIFFQIFNMSITAGYVVLAVLLVRFLIRRLPKIYSYILWIVVGFRLLFPVSVSSAFSFFNLRIFKGVQNKAGQLEYLESAGNSFYPTASNVGAVEQTGEAVVGTVAGNMPDVAMAGQAAAEGSMSGSGTAVWQTLPQIATAIWILGMAVLLIYMTYSFIKMKKQTCRAVFLDGNIFECDGIRSPFVFGFISPRIYIPFHLGEAEREYILKHEQYHIQRKDYLVKIFAYFLVVVYWFQPLVWIAFYFMCQDMEMSCDEKVIASFGNEIKQGYSMLLLSFASPKRIPTGSLSFGEGNVGKRIKNILHFRRTGVVVTIGGIALVVVLSLLFATDQKNENLLTVSMTDEVPVLSGIIPQEEQVKHEYRFESNIKSYLVYADIYNAGVYGGREIIACHDISDERNGFDVLTGINITSDASPDENKTDIRIMYNTDIFSRSALISTPKKATMYAADVLWDDGKTRKIIAEQPYIYKAEYISFGNTKQLESFRCENLNQADAKEWERCISQDCTTILISFVFSEKSEKELRVEYTVPDVPESEVLSEQETQREEALNKEQEEKREQEQKTQLLTVMDRIAGECFGSGEIKVEELGELQEGELNTEEKDRVIRIAAAPFGGGEITAYGLISPEYGSCGIIMDYQINGQSNHNYFEWYWDPYRFSPWMEVADFDRDGEDEAALYLNGGYGTGLHMERLFVFEAWDTGHLEAYELLSESIVAGVNQLVEERVDETNKTIEILEKGTDRVIMSGLSYDLGKDTKFERMAYGSLFHFYLEGDTIILKIHPGIMTNQNAAPVVGSEDELQFEVEYDYSEKRGGYFTLTKPALYQETVD